MRWTAPFLSLLLAGCSGVQNALGGQGKDDRDFLVLGGIFLAVCTVMYLIVIAALIGALLRRRRADASTVETGRHHKVNPLLRTALVGWTALIAIGLIGLAVASFFTDRTMAAHAQRPRFAVEITGNQWWWDVEYRSTNPSLNIRTANELHLPVGVPVQVTLKSNDVIHSFWVPNLAGKQDLIPGRVTDISLLPTKTGLFRGQCAEFCGVQHANMALDVTVQSEADFARWAAAQMKPAQVPRTPLALAGYNYVTSRECSVCHNINGTPASGKVAPDLTHLASRRSIGAGTLPMNRGNLYGWVADPQSQKPGNRMPTIGIPAQDLHAIIAYLETLK